jgi:hypothetical protein
MLSATICMLTARSKIRNVPRGPEVFIIYKVVLTSWVCGATHPNNGERSTQHFAMDLSDPEDLSKRCRAEARDHLQRICRTPETLPYGEGVRHLCNRGVPETLLKCVGPKPETFCNGLWGP